MGTDVSNIKNWGEAFLYGFTREEAKQLAGIDGDKNTISKGVFDMARELLEAMGTGRVNESWLRQFLQKPAAKRIAEIIVKGSDKLNQYKGNGMRLIQAALGINGKGANAASRLGKAYGKEARVKKSQKTEKPAEKPVEEKLPKEVEQMQEVAKQAVEYYSQYNNFKGFVGKGIPFGVTNIRFEKSNKYDDYKNDEVRIDNDGNSSVDRQRDAISVKVTFEFNGKEYSVDAENRDINEQTR